MKIHRMVRPNRVVVIYQSAKERKSVSGLWYLPREPIEILSVSPPVMSCCGRSERTVVELLGKPDEENRKNLIMNTNNLLFDISTAFRRDCVWVHSGWQAESITMSHPLC